MSITNLNNTHLTATQVTDAQNALTQLEAALQIINVNLSAEDRQKYGSINEQNKLFVNKIYDFYKSQPSLSSSDVDWEEFENDFNSRRNLEAFIARLDSLSAKLKNAKPFMIMTITKLLLQIMLIPIIKQEQLLQDLKPK